MEVNALNANHVKHVIWIKQLEISYVDLVLLDNSLLKEENVLTQYVQSDNYLFQKLKAVKIVQTFV